MRCTKCGTEYEGNFCPNCGTPASEIKDDNKINHDSEKTEYTIPQYNPRPPKKKKRKDFGLIVLVIIFIIAAFFFLTGKKEKKAQTETESAVKVAESISQAEPETLAKSEEENAFQVKSEELSQSEDIPISFSSSLDDSNSSVVVFHDMSFRIPDRFGEKADDSKEDVYYFYDRSFSDNQLVALLLGYAEANITEERYEVSGDKILDVCEDELESRFTNIKNKKKQSIEMIGKRGTLYSFEGKTDYADIIMQCAYVYHNGGIYTVGILYSKDITEDISTVMNDVIGAARIGNITESSEETDNVDASTGTNNKSAKGIRPEIKEAIDSYESFFDDYVALMKKYKNNPSDLSLLSEYLDYMSKLSDMEQKFKAIENQDLTTEETMYYAEVTLRIEKKMLEVLG